MGKKQRSKQRRAVTRNAQKGEETDSSVTDNNYAVENKDSRELGGENDKTFVQSAKLPDPKECQKLLSPVGLQNLGNTCFFNSVMQNLVQTPSLRDVLRHQQKLAENRAPAAVAPSGDDCPRLTYKLCPLGPLTVALLNFLESARAPIVNTNNSNKRPSQRARALNPKVLFSQICIKNERFRSFQQQDSQELLHSLFDSIKTEDVKRKKQGILRALDLEHAKAKDVSDEMRSRVKQYGIEVAQNQPSIVDLVFGGLIRSSVLCDECGTVTGVTEPFTDISLPIVDDKRTFHHHHHAKNSPAAKNKNKKPLNLKVGEDVAEDDFKAETRTETETLSKHARKKAKREARRQNKQNRGRNKGNVEQQIDGKDNGDVQAVLNMADELAESVLCGALRGIRISDGVVEEEKEGEEKEEGEEEEEGESETSTGCEIGKVKGGATNLDLESLSDEAPERNGADGDQDAGQEVNASQGADLTSRHNALCDSNRLHNRHCDSNRIDETDRKNVNEFSAGHDVTRGQTDVDQAGVNLLESANSTDDVNGSVGSETTTRAQNEHATDHELEGPSVTNDHAHAITNSVVSRRDHESETNGNHQQENDIFEDQAVNRDNRDVASYDGDSEARHVVSRDRDTSHESDRNDTSDKDDSDDSRSCGDRVSTPNRPQKKSLESLFDTPQHPPVARQLSSFGNKLPQSLAPRCQPKEQECSVQSCLHQFTMAEMLSGANKFGCETCTGRQNKGTASKKTIYCNASKQMLISKPPPVLVIHLKRFHQVGFNLRKVNKHVSIPTTFDLAPFCSTDCKEFVDADSRILYNLYGIVEHSGSMSRGHYTAFVKQREDNRVLSDMVVNGVKPSSTPGASLPPEVHQWYHVSDTIVTRSTEAKALGSNAYLLFYERVFPNMNEHSRS